MNGYEARALDKGDMYVDWDEEHQAWYVFGSESGFAYCEVSSEEEGEEWIREKKALELVVHYLAMPVRFSHG